MSSFRILHVSDLHLCIEPNRINAINLVREPRGSILLQLFQQRHILHPASYDRDIAEGLAALAHRVRAYDLMLVTGDLATTGEADDLRAALAFIDDEAAENWWSSTLRPTLQAAQKPIFLLPGNHDRYSTPRGQAGGTRFDQVFREYWSKPVQHVVLRKASDGEGLAIVAADFCLLQDSDADSPPIFTRYGQGRAYRHVVQQLVAETTTILETYDNVAIVWAMHFPPVAGARRLLRMIDQADVLKAASICDVKVILSGHLHERDHVVATDVHICCAGSATSVDVSGTNSVQMLEFRVAHGQIVGLSRTDYEWDQDATDFVTSAGAPGSLWEANAP